LRQTVHTCAPLVSSDFLVTSRHFPTPSIEVELGGQALERWPRDLDHIAPLQVAARHDKSPRSAQKGSYAISPRAASSQSASGLRPRSITST